MISLADLAVEVAVFGREAEVEPGLRQRRDLIAGLVRGLDPGHVDGRPPRLLGRDRIGGQQPVQRPVQLDQGVVAKPGVGAVAAAADRAQGGGDHPLGVGHDAQPAVLADHDEVAADALLDLVQGAVAAADLLVGDQLQRQRVGHRAGQFAEDLRLHERGHLHVLGAAGVQPVTLAARAELLGRGWHHVEVRVEDDPEPLRSVGADVEERARLAAGLEPLDGETGSDEVDGEIERLVEVGRAVGG